MRAPLAHRLGNEAGAPQMAESIVAIWKEIDLALAPIIGTRGVAALYWRSLHLSSSAHPWLASIHKGAQAAIDLAALKSVIAQQTSGDAAAGSDTLFGTFHDLLAALVGSSLTERLLRSVWAQTLGGPPAQDSSP